MSSQVNQSDLFLLLSNIAVVPAFLYAIAIKKFDSAAILATVSIVSFLYHSCQTNYFCVFNSDIPGESNFYLLQKSDEFFVTIAFVWFILYAVGIGSILTATAIFSLQGVFLLSLLSGKSYSTTIIAITIGIAAFFAIVYALIRPKRLYFVILPSFVSLALLAAGFTLFIIAGDPGETKYYLYHSFWHILLFIAVFFVLMIKANGYSLILKNK